jgi:hypothetical protein
MLQQMETTWDDIEIEKTLWFDDLLLETFHQELMEELKQNEQYYKSLTTEQIKMKKNTNRKTLI